MLLLRPPLLLLLLLLLAPLLGASDHLGQGAPPPGLEREASQRAELGQVSRSSRGPGGRGCPGGPGPAGGGAAQARAALALHFPEALSVVEAAGEREREREKRCWRSRPLSQPASPEAPPVGRGGREPASPHRLPRGPPTPPPRGEGRRRQGSAWGNRGPGALAGIPPGHLPRSTASEVRRAPRPGPAARIRGLCLGRALRPPRLLRAVGGDPPPRGRQAGLRWLRGTHPSSSPARIGRVLKKAMPEGPGPTTTRTAARLGWQEWFRKRPTLP